jgi:hypothetical protein
LTASEIETLVRNSNTSDNWNNILVSAQFDPQLVKQCSFFGLVRIGKLEPLSLGFHNLSLSVGLYNSTIISCDFGDNVCVHNVNYLSHFVVGSEVMIANVNELATTSTAKFGNGIIKDGETEAQRIWLEICNENGGRKVLPFDGMLTADAFLWSKYRSDEKLMNAFHSFTEKKFDSSRGHYGIIGDRTVIKNCKMIKDTNLILLLLSLMKDFKNNDGTTFDDHRRVRGLNETDNLLSGMHPSVSELSSNAKQIDETKPTRYAYVVLGLLLSIYICN